MNKHWKMDLYLTAFNNAVIDFFSDLSGAYPDIALFRVMLAVATQLARTGGDVVHSKFCEHVLGPYEAQLRAQDFSFFLQHDFSEASATDFAGVVSRIKDVWTDMDDANRACVKDHLLTLVRLSDSVSGR